jgi:hypothetical protein
MPSELETHVMRKISFRIVPFIMLLYFISFIDRVNIGFAALTMNKDLGFSPAVFGLGAGIFFVGYFLFEVTLQFDPQQGRSAPLDRAGDDHLGHHFRDVRVHHGRNKLSHFAVLTGRRRGRLLSRYHFISQLLVSCALPRRGGFPVHGCRSHIGGSRLTAFECFVGDGRLAWPPGLAVDVHYGSHPGVPSWLRRPGLHDGQAGKGDVVEG